MKVLIISHNVISTDNNMGKTLLSLFSEFSKEELCQLYVYPIIPNIDKCNSYYCITDKDILKSLYNFSSPGKELDKVLIKNSNSIMDAQTGVYTSTNNNKPMRRILRDIMWKLSRWDNDKLENWIRKEKPICIFLAPGYAKFIYDIALKIATRYDLPIITYICDDYYFVKEPKDFIGKIQLSLLREKINSLMSNTQHIIGICDEICELYSSKFGVPATTIMTGSSFEIAKEVKIVDKPQSISYFGNLGCNRYISLAEIGQCLDEINRENGTEFKLKIYTGETDKRILDKLAQASAIELKNFVVGDEFKKEFFSSELLLHVEAFDEDSMDKVKHSVSTKIADSLASGIPLVAYGPESLVSIKHLSTNKCAYILTSDLKKSLMKLFGLNDKTHENIVKASIEIARKFHEKPSNSKLLKKILEDCHE